jgi:hypothetical protein
MNKVKNKSVTMQVYDDLGNYLKFCKEYGYPYKEQDLYNTNNYIYRQYQKLVQGKSVKNNWEIDLARFKEEASEKKHSNFNNRSFNKGH